MNLLATTALLLVVLMRLLNNHLLVLLLQVPVMLLLHFLVDDLYLGVHAQYVVYEVSINVRPAANVLLQNALRVGHWM